MQPSLSILLVEAHPALSQARVAVLERNGYRVTSCEERNSAVLYCGAQPFDVAVLGPSIEIEDARRLEWDLRTINPELKVLSVGEWDNLGLDEIHKPEFLLGLLDNLSRPIPSEPERKRRASSLAHR